MLYKRWIRKKIELYQESHPGFTLCKLSSALQIEPSYLSRFLGSGNVHFSDELLYRLLKTIDLSENEIDYVLLTKEYERTEHPERKKYLQLKLKTFRLHSWKTELDKLHEQLSDLTKLIHEVSQ